MRFKSNVRISRRTVSKIRANLISYEMVCAILRSAPMRAYLEFEAQPAIKEV